MKKHSTRRSAPTSSSPMYANCASAASSSAANLPASPTPAFPAQPPLSAVEDVYPQLGRCLLALLFFGAVTFPSLLLYRASHPISLAQDGFRFQLRRHIDFVDVEMIETRIKELDTESEDSRLERVLKEAAMVDNTVILTTINFAWAKPGSVVDLFLDSFRIGDRTRRLLDHLVMVALDREAYTRCLQIHPHCFALATEGVDFSGQKNFMTDGYLKMMWRRIDFLRTVLEKGYDFIFTDTDIMWFRDPLPNFYGDGDFQIACDHFNGDSFDIHNRPNGGFNYVRSNNRTIEFYKFWHLSRLMHPGYHDQDVLNYIKNDPFVHKIGLKMRFLNTEYFGGLCELSRDFNKVCTMHANCCVGLPRKLHDLRVMLEDWKRFMSLPPSVQGSKLVAWSVPQNCSLAPFHP